MPDTNNSPPSRVNWFLLGTAFGLIAYPFYAVLFGPDPKSKRLRAA